MRAWRPLLLVIAVQIGILALIPGRRVEAQLGGDEIVLQTVPVDPYDMLAGYYATLRYAAEQAPRDPEVEALAEGSTVYIWLEHGETSAAPIKVATSRPLVGADIPFVRAKWRRGSVRITDAERFYFPEERRDEINKAFVDAGGRALVTLRLAPDGTPLVTKVRVNGRDYP